jgi:hypothetical protein
MFVYINKQVIAVIDDKNIKFAERNIIEGHKYFVRVVLRDETVCKWQVIDDQDVTKSLKTFKQHGTSSVS